MVLMAIINDSSLPIIGKPASTPKLMEVCRSFSYKMNLANHGGPQYESADFFCSRKVQCNEEDAEWVSQQIFEECVAEVRASMLGFKSSMQQKIANRNGNGGRRPSHPAEPADSKEVTTT